MAKQKGYYGGFLGGMNFTARLTEIAFLVMMQKAIEEKEYQKLGYDTVREWVKAEFDFSYDSLNDRLKLLRTYGREFAELMVRLGRKPSEMKLIDSAIATDQSTGKKGLKIGDKVVIPSEETQAEIQAELDRLTKEASLARNIEQRHKRDLDQIDRERKKEMKALVAETETLRAQIISPETPEQFKDGMDAIQQHITEIAMICSKLDFEKAHEGIPDGPIKAKYEAIIGGAEAQFAALVQKMRDAVYGRA